MTTCLGKSCSFDLPRVPFVNCCQFVYMCIGFEGRMWDPIVSVPYHYLFTLILINTHVLVICIIICTENESYCSVYKPVVHVQL